MATTTTTITVFRVADSDGLIESTTIWSEVLDLIADELEIGPIPRGMSLDTLRENVAYHLGWTIETVEYLR